MKKILILGSGAREHALSEKFYESSYVSKVCIYPGNDGVIGFCDKIDEEFNLNDISSLKKFDLVFVGNEQYLADGIVNFLLEHKINVVGPTKEAARIESSKIFAKDLMKKYNVPTAFYNSFSNIEKALEFVKDKTFPLVLKADGLAAGKGVLIAENIHEAESFIKEMLSGNKFGEAGKQIVIEEYLHGEEASIFAFCDGEDFVSTIFSQDHKKEFDGNKGLNTGGMGAYAPVDKFSHLKDEVDKLVFEPILRGMKEEGCPFVGILYAGLMINNSQIKVIEFNCRLGDPETQVLLPLLENDLYEISEAICNKRIKEIELKWHNKYAVAVVLASKGYPESFEKGHKIFVDKELLIDGKIKVYFAGVKKDNSVSIYRGLGFTNSGGRVMSLCAIHDSLEMTREYAYSKIGLIESNILRYRNDIARL